MCEITLLSEYLHILAVPLQFVASYAVNPAKIPRGNQGHGAILQLRPLDRSWSYFDMIPDYDIQTDRIYHS